MHLYLYFVERKTAWWPVEGTTQRVSDIAIFPEQLREIDGKLLLLKYQWNDKGMPQITCAKSCVIVANKFYLYLHQTVHKTSTQMYLFFMSRVPLYNVIADCTQSSSVSLSSALSLVISLESIDFNLKLLRRLWSHAAEWEGCKKSGTTLGSWLQRSSRSRNCTLLKSWKISHSLCTPSSGTITTGISGSTDVWGHRGVKTQQPEEAQPALEQASERVQKHSEVAQMQQVSELPREGHDWEVSEKTQKPGEVFESLDIHQGYPLECVLKTWTSYQ